MSEPTAPSLEWPGLDDWTVPGYLEERPLGRGVSGRVVAAVSNTTGQRVAIKYFDQNLLQGDPRFLRKLRADADLLKSLDSAHVARIFDFVEEPGRGAAVVTALVEGVSLREMITRRGPLGAEAALVVLKDTLLGLAAAHSLPVNHRDLKPDNVLIDANGWCTLTDFDIAVKPGKRVRGRGTPPYMAPELWDGGSSGPTSDIYAATVTLWESVTGKPPFSGGLRRLRRQHKSATVPVDRVDQALQGLIASGLAKDPAERPQSARSVVHDLEAAAADAHGPGWEEQGRSELGERAAALLPLLAGEGGKGGKGAKSATATRLARRRLVSVALAGTAAVVALVVLGAAALSAMSGSGKAQVASLAALSAAASSAQVIVTPPVSASACATPTTFTYSGTVTATQPGILYYRWLYSSGKQGPVQTLKFTAPGNEQVSGGTVEAAKAGTGWAEISVLTAIPKTSNKATYQLLCTTANSGVTLSASVQPNAQTVSSCADAPPTLTAHGSIKAKKAESVRYYWALADGQKSPTRTVTFKRPGTSTLPPLKITPPALPASGEAVLVVTKPVAAASKPAKYTVSCIAPISTVPNPPAQGGGTSPTSGRSSAGSPPSAGHTTTAANPSHTAGAPTTPATTATSPAPPSSPSSSAPSTSVSTSDSPTSVPTSATPTPSISISIPISIPTPSITPT
jgi:eukaryotic-like serine/threonine-protein kinase